MNLTQKINRFRNLLHDTLNDMSDPDSLHYVDNLIHRFDELFPAKIFSDEMDYLRDLTLKYCYQETRMCPICGAALTNNVSHRERKFMGCTEFPKCRGARSRNGSPTINDAMREFLAEKLKEDGIHDDISSARFKDLDL